MSHQRGASALTAAFERAGAWMTGLAEHGPDVRVTAHLKTVEEAGELAATPDDIEEWADVYICLAGVAAQNRWTMAELAVAVHAKITKNESRTWAQNPDGTWSHVAAAVGRAAS